MPTNLTGDWQPQSLLSSTAQDEWIDADCVLEFQHSLRRLLGTCIQDLLKEEVTDFLHRPYHGRQSSKAPIHRNGFGKRRQVNTAVGFVVVRCPRLRGLKGGYRSSLLDELKPHLFEAKRLAAFLDIWCDLDFDRATEILLRDTSGLSSSGCQRLAETWNERWSGFLGGDLETLRLDYLWLGHLILSPLVAVFGAVGSSGSTKHLLGIGTASNDGGFDWTKTLDHLRLRGLARPRQLLTHHMTPRLRKI